MINRRALGLGAAMAALFAAGPGVANAATRPGGGTTTTVPTCNAPALAQVYSWAQDSYWYANVPGVSWDTWSSSGWTLSGGAKVMADTLADGVRGNVLYMPSGSKAVSPQMCV